MRRMLPVMFILLKPLTRKLLKTAGRAVQTSRSVERKLRKKKKPRYGIESPIKKTFRGKEPFSRRERMKKGKGDYSWGRASEPLNQGFSFRRTGPRFLSFASRGFSF